MKLFDSHCHLDDKVYDSDFTEVVLRMKNAGVAGATIVGVDRESSEKAVALARSEAIFRASVGVHPHDAKHCSESTLSVLGQLAGDENVCAWGETGLDFNRMFSPQKDQEHWFKRQLEMAHANGLPVILHERDSEGRLLELLSDHAAASGGRVKGVIHCFSGTRPELVQYLDLGLCIGITGIVTLKQRGRELRQQVALIPEDRILIETDAPYLTPAPEKNRSRRNEPAFVKSVLMKLAAVRNQDPESLAESIWNNTCRLYNLA